LDITCSRRTFQPYSCFRGQEARSRVRAIRNHVFFFCRPTHAIRHSHLRQIASVPQSLSSGQWAVCSCKFPPQTSAHLVHHHWTGLAAFIILFEDMSGWSNRHKWLFRWLVLFCGLSGPYAAVLAPIFALSYFVYREPERLVRAGILALAA
jgi:hypothetical protein